MILFGCQKITPADTPEIQFISPGELKALISHSSKPYILLNFYTSWCRPCRSEIPNLATLHTQKLQTEVELILINLEKASAVRQKAHPTLKRLGIAFQTYAIRGNINKFMRTVAPDYNGTIPYSILLRKSGKVIATYKGKISAKTIQKAVNWDQTTQKLQRNE